MLSRVTIFWSVVLALLCISISAPTFSQTITVNPNTLDIPSRDQLVNDRAFYVNGVLTQGLTPDMAKTRYRLGPMSRTLLTLTALRMNAAGLLTLDEPVAHTLPALLDENPFLVALTPRHILTETAGFAVPPIYGPNVPFQHYLTQIRTAGQMAHTDPVAWRLLSLFLEAKGKASINELFKVHILGALGSAEYTVSDPDPHGHLDWLGHLTAEGALIAEIARLTIRNRDKDGARFLPADIYNQFILRQNWRMHPMGPRRTLGGVMHELDDRTYTGPPALADGSAGATFMAFPDQGVTFITLGKPTAAYDDAVRSVAASHFLPAAPDNRLAEANGLYDKGFRFTGNYVRSDAPSAWLADRLAAIDDDRLKLSDPGNGTLILEESAGEILILSKKAPFLFESLGGDRLILSPYRQGGYLVLNNVLYVYVGMLGNRTFVLGLFPFAVTILLTSVLYVRSGVSVRWRRMAFFGTTGTLLVLCGLAADYFLWPKAVLVWDASWLAIIWRAAINIGLAFVLSLPLFAISLTKKGEMPTNAAIFMAPLHLGLLGISALALFLILVAWGVAGEFSAY